MNCLFYTQFEFKTGIRSFASVFNQYRDWFIGSHTRSTKIYFMSVLTLSFCYFQSMIKYRVVVIESWWSLKCDLDLCVSIIVINLTISTLSSEQPNGLSAKIKISRTEAIEPKSHREVTISDINFVSVSHKDCNINFASCFSSTVVFVFEIAKSIIIILFF